MRDTIVAMSTPLRIFSIAAVLLVLALALLKGQNQGSQSTAARFQLVQGEYVALSGNQSIPEKGFFKIDTNTGKTWKFMSGAVNGKYIQRWLEVVEPAN
jgi:hypothetical protein